MPSIKDNFLFWSTYDWSHGGEDWSRPWGGTDILWNQVVLPRIAAFLPARRILEIGPGYGRFTRYLKDACRELVVVDLSDRCIEACRRRFSVCRNIAYHANDGKSLSFLSPASIDFAFSFDSLVHAEEDVIRAYLSELACKLKPGGIGFFHHSNLGRYVPPAGCLPRIKRPFARAATVTAESFARACAAVGLRCLRQEIVNWGGRHLIDCFSLFAPRGSRGSRRNRVVENPHFMREAARLRAARQRP